ncbi:MAG: beta-lactamase family protein, partial [Holophaga sp.]|nr:beta-lactamase family protein [Holophaga sp.]
MKHPVLAFLLAASVLPATTPQQQLRAALEARFVGDRTGVTVAAALVGDAPAEAIVSADALHPAKVDAHTAFEIGSVAKTMASALVADLLLKGEASLDDPLSRFLPRDAKVPGFDGRPITLAHVRDYIEHLYRATQTPELTKLRAGQEIHARLRPDGGLVALHVPIDR